MSCSFVRLDAPLGCFPARRSFLFLWRRNSSPSIFSDVYSKPFWVQHTGAARQAHTCQAIILRNDKVAGMYAVY